MDVPNLDNRGLESLIQATYLVSYPADIARISFHESFWTSYDEGHNLIHKEQEV